jgi:hypothetical protein
MKAKEIQERIANIEVDYQAKENDDASMGTCFWLAQIALQLAEANYHLAKIANPLMAYDGPRWVHFKRGLGELLIDANGVIGVGRETGELTCIICAAGKRFVDGTVEEVCKKLNIPIGG